MERLRLVAVILAAVLAGGAAGHFAAPTTRLRAPPTLTTTRTVSAPSNREVQEELETLKHVETEVAASQRLHRIEGCLPDLTRFIVAVSYGRNGVPLLPTACLGLFYPEGVPP
jgi:hypothetical protein